MSKLFYNKVKFFGTEPEITAIKQIFTEVRLAGNNGDWKCLPEIYRDEHFTWMINIKLIETDFYTMVVYDTVNASNTKDILKVGEAFDIALMHDCIDSYLTIDGAVDEFRGIQASIGDKYIFTPGKAIQKVELTGTDLDQVKYNHFIDQYVYKTTCSVFIEDICDIILFEKIAKLNLQSP